MKSTTFAACVSMVLLCTHGCQRQASQQTAARVGGSVWHYSSNLLKNPDAASLSVPPFWQQTSGTWSVSTTPVTISSLSINSSDGSPWFLNTSSAFHNSNCSSCGKNVTATLTQVVNLSVTQQGILNTHAQAGFVYGGDAFAAGSHSGTGSGSAQYGAQNSYEATFTLRFFRGSTFLGSDTTGNIFASVPFCFAPTQVDKSYGYRRTVINIPAGTTTIHFVATVLDRLRMCNNQSTGATFKNGFDNLWLQFAFLGAPTATLSFQRGPAPPRPTRMPRKDSDKSDAS